MKETGSSNNRALPGELVIITDPEHPLYDQRIFERTTDPEFRKLKENIRVYGIIEPVIVRQGPNSELVVVAGRRRVRAAQVLAEEGENISVPYFLQEKAQNFGTNPLGVMISENEIRRGDNAVVRARKIQRFLDESENIALAEKTFGLHRRTLRDHMDLLKMSPEVLKAVERGKLAYDLALEWKDLSHEKQEAKLQTMVEKAEEKGKEKVTRKEKPFELGKTKWSVRQIKEAGEYAQTPKNYKLLLRIVAGAASEDEVKQAKDQFTWLEVLEA